MFVEEFRGNSIVKILVKILRWIGVIIFYAISQVMYPRNPNRLIRDFVKIFFSREKTIYAYYTKNLLKFNKYFSLNNTKYLLTVNK